MARGSTSNVRANTVASDLLADGQVAPSPAPAEANLQMMMMMLYWQYVKTCQNTS